MKTPALLFALLSVVLVFGTVTCGCSLIGFGIDRSSPPDTLVAHAEDKGLEGKDVLVALQDGYSFAGECRRVGSLPAELYRSRFVQWKKESDNRFFPLTLGDTLVVVWDKGQVATASLDGFSRNAVIIRLLPKKNPTLHSLRPEVLSLPIEKVDSLRRTTGLGVSLSWLQAELQQGNIPTTGGILVRRGEASVWIAFDEISEVREIRYSYDWLYKGAIADVVGLIAAVAYLAVRK